MNITLTYVHLTELFAILSHIVTSLCELCCVYTWLSFFSKTRILITDAGHYVLFVVLASNQALPSHARKFISTWWGGGTMG